MKSIESSSDNDLHLTVHFQDHRYPMCICWTPIPLLSWFLPFVGHVGIATTDGKIRDFSGDYRVNKDKMEMGWPTSYCQLSLSKVSGGALEYDQAVEEASNEYKNHRHNIFSDNCHSHVALALNKMNYAGKANWNAVTVCWYILRFSRPISFIGFAKQYGPFVVLFASLIVIFYFIVAQIVPL